MSLKKAITLIIISPIIFSCNKCKNEEVTPLSSGSFGITLISETNPNGRINSTSRLAQTSEISFDLGQIKETRELGFLLTNQGETSIFDVVISSSNSSFAIFPTSISELKPLIFVDNQSSLGLIPLINLTIIHGISPTGVGYAETLPAEINDAIITFEGKTLNGSDTVDVELEIDVIVSALIMDIELKSDGEIVDLTKPVAISKGLMAGKVNHYNVGSNQEIKNIGNVKILLTVDSSAQVELNPSEAYSFNSKGLIQLDGNNTISNYNKFKLGHDRNVYLYFN
ncbi:MAG: hypothetical protein OCD76_06800 [Reichenbachiella sp.]